MNYLNYDGELDFDRFDNFINELKQCNQEEAITFFLTTNGGDLAVADMMFTALANYPKDILVIVNQECSSAGFRFLTKAIKNAKFLLSIGDATFSIVHKAAVEYSIAEIRKGTDKAKFWTNRLDYLNDKSLKSYKQLDFTDKELELISEGEDVYLDAEDLRRVLKLKIRNVS